MSDFHNLSTLTLDMIHIDGRHGTINQDCLHLRLNRICSTYFVCIYDIHVINLVYLHLQYDKPIPILSIYIDSWTGYNKYVVWVN